MNERITKLSNEWFKIQFYDDLGYTTDKEEVCKVGNKLYDAYIEVGQPELALHYYKYMHWMCEGPFF